jgi:hypothetical protein
VAAQHGDGIVAQVGDTATGVAVDLERVEPASDAGQVQRAALFPVRQVSLEVLQILGLWTLQIAGVRVVEKMNLPDPR